jgi:hypothetical protein
MRLSPRARMALLRPAARSCRHNGRNNLKPLISYRSRHARTDCSTVWLWRVRRKKSEHTPRAEAASSGVAPNLNSRPCPFMFADAILYLLAIQAASWRRSRTEPPSIVVGDDRGQVTRTTTWVQALGSEPFHNEARLLPRVISALLSGYRVIFEIGLPGHQSRVMHRQH